MPDPPLKPPGKGRPQNTSSTRETQGKKKDSLELTALEDAEEEIPLIKIPRSSGLSGLLFVVIVQTFANTCQ